eukprot:TRINITY_DN6548_c0_g1_i2.p1 TRINITY_DN6548_c0_g1~~TRINITY_DN6548_c0_g1_i2.p1  ORF type:complete len:154 (+),score=21.04 TRINITY_DN6548_c0_g1_i2:46-507(+)
MASQESEPELKLKLILLGNPGAGKSSILVRYVMDAFSDETRATVGVDFRVKNLKVHGKPVKCFIWDTAGQEVFSSVTKGYYRGIHGCLLVFELIDDNPFHRLNHWFHEVQKYTSDEEFKPIILLIGNKLDLVEKYGITEVSCLNYTTTKPYAG